MCAPETGSELPLSRETWPFGYGKPLHARGDVAVQVAVERVAEGGGGAGIGAHLSD
jgi:hypothetical protein